MIKIKKIQTYEKDLRDEEQITPSAFFDHSSKTDKTIKQQSQILATLQSLRPKETQKQIPEHLMSLCTESRFQNQLFQTSIFSKSKAKVGFKKTTSNESYRASQSLQPQMMKKRNKWFQLQEIITAQKVKALKNAFVQKLKRNNQFSEPVQFQTSNYTHSNSILDQQGLQLPEIADQLFSVIYICDIMASLFMYPLALVFPEVADQTQLMVFQIFSLTFLIGEMIVNFVQKKMVYGRKIQTLRQISSWYIQNHFFLDLINILSIILAISTKIPIFSFFRLLGLYKINQLFQKLQRLEIYIIQNYYNEQYWSLIKTLIFNFCFAHFLAILLIIMTEIDHEKNWMVVKQIDNAYWGERYIWSYYWGINIMLTVGFGDMVATTYKEALCLIFIQTISCLALAYNINCIGNLIVNIRAQDIQKSKNFKIFKKMVDKNNLPQELNEQINNYIHDSINVKKKFNLEEQKNFIEKLPNSFKTQVLRESNKNIFQNLTFFHNLVEKTLFSLAEKIQMVITHPEEIIQPLQDKFNLLILKSGEIGYMCKKPGSTYNNKIIDTVKINPEDNPFLINLNFITKKRQNFQIKSLVYSMIYFLEHEKLIEIFKESQMDYQLYAYLRDKNKYIIDQLEVLKCEFCKTKHTKFQCPKIHYIPIAMHVINKWRHSYQVSKNSRNKMFRFARVGNNSLGLFRYLQDQQFGASFMHQKNMKNTFDNRQMLKYVQIKRRRQTMRQSSEDMTQSRKKDLAFIEQTTQIIKQQLTKLLGAQEFEDETWNLQLDKMKNFKGYFSSDNPNNLKQKFNLKKRLQKSKSITSSQILGDKPVSSFQLLNKCKKIPINIHNNPAEMIRTIISNSQSDNWKQ